MLTTLIFTIFNFNYFVVKILLLLSINIFIVVVIIVNVRLFGILASGDFRNTVSKILDEDHVKE